MSCDDRQVENSVGFTEPVSSIIPPLPSTCDENATDDSDCTSECSSEGTSGSSDVSDSASEGSDDEPEATTPTVPEDDYHEDVELMLCAEPLERLELMSLDPAHYLKIIETYTKTRDGREIYLPYLFNFLISRPDGRLRLKFKLTDDGAWHEVGYDGGNFSEDDVYKAFADKVKSLMSRPNVANERDQFMQNLINPDIVLPKIVAPESPIAPSEKKVQLGVVPPSQGNQLLISKVDRFLGRTRPEALPPKIPEPLIDIAKSRPGPNDDVPDVEPLADEEPGPASVPSAPEEPAEPDWEVGIQQIVTEVTPVTTVNPVTPARDNSLLTSAVLQYCPSGERESLSRLLEIASGRTDYSRSILELLPTLSKGGQLLLTNYLQYTSAPAL